MRPYGPGITDTIALVGIVFTFLVFWKYEKVELVEGAILPQKNPDNISPNGHTRSLVCVSAESPRGVYGTRS